jgi:hypothetical protein
MATALLTTSPIALGAPHELNLINPASPTSGEGVKVDFSRRGDTLIVHFDVKTAKVNPKINPAELYNGDVVEIFLNTTASKGLRPYYEFEVSPYDQQLLVKITEVGGKAHFDEAWKLKSFTHSVSVHPGKGWEATMQIPLKDIGWDGTVENISGNAFCILGVKGQRRYYSLNLPKQDKPSFHKPEFFRPFDIESASPAQAAGEESNSE